MAIAAGPTCSDGATPSGDNKPTKVEFRHAKVEVRISTTHREESPEGLHELVRLWPQWSRAIKIRIRGNEETLTPKTLTPQPISGIINYQ